MNESNPRRRCALVAIAVVALLSVPAYARVEVVRTADGIPHVTASDWSSLGKGFGYAQAEDALCTLAEGFTTFEGRRSLYFGPENRPSEPSTFGRPANIALDTFFKALLSRQQVERFEQAQPKELLDTIDGFAAGYNERLRRLNADRTARQMHPCASQLWVRPIDRSDMIRRMLAVGIAAGYSKFVTEIASARPPSSPLALTDIELANGRATGLGDGSSLGSNVLAFGKELTGGQGSVLLGNPHWFWSGPDRFYQVHLTIPGVVDVAGAAFLGVPVVMIGFNASIAWSHTVSAARRFGVFELPLKAGSTDTYQQDGKEHRLQAIQVPVETRQGNGPAKVEYRTVYRSHLGPILNLSGRSAALGWTAERTFAIKDANEDNYRVFRTFWRWSMAKSLDEFADIQRSEQGVPWVHTVAIGRDDGRVWYADIGPVPNVPDAHRARCTTPIGRRFAAADPIVPFLDGGRAECEWKVDSRTTQPGIVPWQEQPSQWREDYAANMNGSYWLVNAWHPLEGYARTLGGEQEPLSLRSRLGHQIAQQLLELRPLPVDVTGHLLRAKALDSRSHSATLYRAPVLKHVCAQRAIQVEVDPLTGVKFEPPRQVDLLAACRVLAAWNGTSDTDDGGSILWDAFWDRMVELPGEQRYRVAFSAKEPLRTPGELNVSEPAIPKALGAAVLALQKEHIPLDASMGSRLAAGSAAHRLAMYGGCSTGGYFTIACDDAGNFSVMSPSFLGNSYMQVVSFDAHGPRAYTMMAHGQRERAVVGDTPDSGVLRYVKREWLPFKFDWTDVRAAAKGKDAKVVLH